MCPITPNSVAHMHPARVARHSTRPLTVVAAAALLASCSSSEPPTPPAGEPTSPGTTAQAASPGGAGISPGGVTTTVNADPSSTQSEFYHACNSALIWMSQRQGDPHAQIEPYLKMVQASPSGENGTWNRPWAQLSAEQQAAVILAVTTAADGGC